MTPKGHERSKKGDVQGQRHTMKHNETQLRKFYLHVSRQHMFKAGIFLNEIISKILKFHQTQVKSGKECLQKK